jgi:hypothetical protein
VIRAQPCRDNLSEPRRPRKQVRAGERVWNSGMWRRTSFPTQESFNHFNAFVEQHTFATLLKFELLVYSRRPPYLRLQSGDPLLDGAVRIATVTGGGV